MYFTPRMVTTDMLALREAAMAGVGVVQLPINGARSAGVRGIEVVLDEWQPRREVIHAVFASRRGLLPSVRALVDYLSEVSADGGGLASGLAFLEAPGREYKEKARTCVRALLKIWR